MQLTITIPDELIAEFRSLTNTQDSDEAQRWLAQMVKNQLVTARVSAAEMQERAKYLTEQQVEDKVREISNQALEDANQQINI